LFFQLAETLVYQIIQLGSTLVQRSAYFGNLFLDHRGPLSETVQLNDHFLDSYLAHDITPD
jgi:hypothetical protein